MMEIWAVWESERAVWEAERWESNAPVFFATTERLANEVRDRLEAQWNIDHATQLVETVDNPGGVDPDHEFRVEKHELHSTMPQSISKEK